LLQELAAARELARTAEATLEERHAAAAAGQQSANKLKFDEAATRARLIDSLLVSAGWNVGAKGKSTDEVNPESVEYESHEIDKKVFNLDTNGLILENLMANGIKDATGYRRPVSASGMKCFLD
jgi:hypothetical protein